MENKLKSRFEEIAKDNEWGSQESVSGTGSELKNTQVLIQELEYLCAKYDIKSILDIPCGDYNWMKEVTNWFTANDISYLGCDIVDSVVETNKKLYPNVNFQVGDIIKDKLPKVDLIFVRDCIGHLSNDNIFKALENIRMSGSKYLLVTSFTKYNHNPSIKDGEWKPINLMILPFLLRPIYLINENCQEVYPFYNDKCMILIDLNNMYGKY